MVSIHRCKVINFDFSLAQLGQFKQTLFELTSLFSVTEAVKVFEAGELLFVVKLSLEAALHDFFSHLFNAVDE